MISSGSLRVAGVIEGVGRRDRTGRGLSAALALLCAATLLSACGNLGAGRFETAAPVAAPQPAKPKPTVAQTPASEREHERILATYGGAYDDPKLEGLIS